MTTATDVAEWMAEKVLEDKSLYQNDAAPEIERRFGAAFVYLNANRNLAIKKDVLAIFNKLTKDNVVWSRRFHHWRPREKDDLPGRRQT
jgi:hypothetical protein